MEQLQQSDFNQSASPPSSPVVAIPTSTRLIEKYSSPEGRARWLSPRNVSRDLEPDGLVVAPITDVPSSTSSLFVGGVRSVAQNQDEQPRMERELQQWKLRRIHGGGLQKRSPDLPPTAPIPPQCESFVNVDLERRTLSSPRLPNSENYPNNTDCQVVLEGE